MVLIIHHKSSGPDTETFCSLSHRQVFGVSHILYEAFQAFILYSAFMSQLNVERTTEGLTEVTYEN